MNSTMGRIIINSISAALYMVVVATLLSHLTAYIKVNYYHLAIYVSAALVYLIYTEAIFFSVKRARKDMGKSFSRLFSSGAYTSIIITSIYMPYAAYGFFQINDESERSDPFYPVAMIVFLLLGLVFSALIAFMMSRKKYVKD